MRTADWSDAPVGGGRFPMAALHLTSARLDFRPIGLGDLGAIAALHADGRVSGLLVDGVPDTAPKALAFLGWNQPMYARGYGTFVVRRLGEPGLIGLFSLTPFGGDESLLELGGKLAPSAWRGGLAVEAGAAMIAHAFDTLGRDRLISAYHPDNRSVPAALARLGFVADGDASLFDRAVNTMRLDRTAWEAQGASPRRPA